MKLRLAAKTLPLRLLLPVLLLALLPAFAARAQTQAPQPPYAAQAGVAIGGYDAVAFFREGAAERGQRRHAVMWKGVTWRFASAASRARFEANPRAYAPVYGGYCAYAMSRGVLAPGDPQLWVISEGRLYLLNNPDARQLWLADQAALIARARQHWPGILGR